MYISLRIRKKGDALCYSCAFYAGGGGCYANLCKRRKNRWDKASDHNVSQHCKNEDRSGEYVITPIELEKDLLYLKQNGYTTVFVNDVIRYVKRGASCLRSLSYCPLMTALTTTENIFCRFLKKYDMKATVSIVGAYTDAACEEAEPDPAYSYLDWQDVSVFVTAVMWRYAITLTICTILKAGVESVSWREKATRITERYFLTTPRSFKRFAMNTVVFSQTFTPILSA